MTHKTVSTFWLYKIDAYIIMKTFCFIGCPTSTTTTTTTTTPITTTKSTCK